MIDNSDRDARMYLLHVAEHPSPRTRAYAAERGVVQATSDIHNGIAPADVLAETRAPGRSILDDVTMLEVGRASLLIPRHTDWPETALGDLGELDQPFALWVRGSASLAGLASNAVAITGSRASSSYGTTVSSDLAADLGCQGVTVINGGSFGIDEAALRATVRTGGRAVVVLPCGIDQTYPHANASLFDSVVDSGGLLVSEYGPGCAPSRARFAARARLIAALGSVVVIVEAGRRSGACAVAKVATRLGRTVLGVPGSIYSATSAGVHELLRAGVAQLVTSVGEIPHTARHA